MPVRGWRCALPRSGGIWLLRDVREPRRSSKGASASLFLGVTTGLLGTITFTLAGSPRFPGICPVESILAIGAVLQDDGSLDRRALRDIVFSDEQARRDLEAITHPAIGRELYRQIHTSDSPYTVLVSPLLLEGSQKEMVHRILVIDVPPEVQVARTVARDTVPEAQVQAIMRAQMDRERRLAAAHDVVENHGPLRHLHERLDALHETYLELAQRHGG